MSEATFGAWAGRAVKPRPAPVSYKTSSTTVDDGHGQQMRAGVLILETVGGETVTFWSAETLGTLIAELQQVHEVIQKPLVQLASVLPTSRTNGPPWPTTKGQRT